MANLSIIDKLKRDKILDLLQEERDSLIKMKMRYK